MEIKSAAVLPAALRAFFDPRHLSPRRFLVSSSSAIAGRVETAMMT
jgi:hypothetical protein